jgi:hypothetical protein
MQYNVLVFYISRDFRFKVTIRNRVPRAVIPISRDSLREKEGGFLVPDQTDEGSWHINPNMADLLQDLYSFHQLYTEGDFQSSELHRQVTMTRPLVSIDDASDVFS